jgi:hypothetical protein
MKLAMRMVVLWGAWMLLSGPAMFALGEEPLRVVLARSVCAAVRVPRSITRISKKC